MKRQTNSAPLPSLLLPPPSLPPFPYRGKDVQQPKLTATDIPGVLPRQILPNQTYLITRRTTQRLFLLRPSPKVNACIRYCLALALKRSGVKIHVAVFLSNHYHLIVTDPQANLPVFTEELNKLLARSLNCLHQREENFWSGGDQTSYVRLESEHDVLAKCVYALANPTAAGLVAYGSEWPGVRLFCKGSYLAKKPKFFFRSEEDGGLPDRMTLELTPPPIGVPAKRCDDVVKQAVAAREKQLRTQAKLKGRRFLGAAAVKAQSIDSRPRTPTLRGDISPRLACRDKWRRIEKLLELKQFVHEHKERRKEFLGGDRAVVFPAGTYRFVTQFGARFAEV